MNDNVKNDFPKWFSFAESLIGTKEIVGNGNNPTIVEFFKCTDLGPQPDSVPWCAAFANYCLQKTGFKGTGKANARSFCNLPALVEPKIGCIVVIPRGSNEWQGHVGFLKSWTKVGPFYKLEILGGNQGDAVTIKNFYSKPVGFYWPMPV